MNIIIPLGGKGERFIKDGFHTPKPLIKILDKEMISYVLDPLKLQLNDKTNVYVVYGTSNDSDCFREYMSRRYPWVNLINIQQNTRGAVETVVLGLKQIDKTAQSRPLLLLDCDTYYSINIVDKVNLTTPTIFYFLDEDTTGAAKYSYIKLRHDNSVEDIAEKVRISNYANTGAYFFPCTDQYLEYAQTVLEKDIQFKNEYYTSCIYKLMIDDGVSVHGQFIDSSNVISLGTPEQVRLYQDNTYAFLFDLDGTLINTDKVYAQVWKEILISFNIFLSDEMFFKYIQGKNDATVIKQLLPSCTDVGSISLRKDELFCQKIDQILIMDCIPFLSEIKRAGHKICIVTNCNRMAAECIIKFFKLDLYMDHLVIGNECSLPKPSPAPYIQALKFLDMPSSKAIIFEDSKSGITSAIQACPKCLVGIASQHDTCELELFGCDVTTNTFATLSISELTAFRRDEMKILKNAICQSLYQDDVTHIEIDDVKLKGGYIADVHRVKITTKNKTLDCILKLKVEHTNNLNKMANDLDLYGREFYFYESIYNHVNICVPKFHGIIKNSNLNSIGILLENLNVQDFKFPLDLNNESIETTLKVVDRLSKLHAKFWNKDLHKIFPLLKKNNDPLFYPTWGNFIKTNWDVFEKKWSCILTSTHIQLGKIIVTHFNTIQDQLSKGNLTFTHGDVKAGNMFFRCKQSGYEPYFIDWQYIAHAKGVQDLVFFMIESFEVSTIKTYYNLLKEYYYIKLIENGVDYSKEDYYQDFTLAACYYPFFVAIWFGITPKEHLIDVNFPFFFIQKIFAFLQETIGDTNTFENILQSMQK